MLIGPSGSGKTTLVVHLCSTILTTNKNIYIIYIDGDLSISKIKELDVEELMFTYNDRFRYAGKTNDY